MREVGVLEAKTTFSALIAEVERTGEAVTVTRNGRAAARIVPIRPDARSAEDAEARRRRIAGVLARRDARPVVPGFDDLGWEELKRIGRNEDRHD